MDERFIQDAEDKVDGENGGEDEVRLGAEGCLEGLKSAGELSLDGFGEA
jgi:hypothetical protein